jgi:hypothetical protein
MQLQMTFGVCFTVKHHYLICFLLLSICANSQDSQMYPCKTPCNIGAQIADYKPGDSITVDALLKAVGIKAEAGKFTILSYRITIDASGFSSDLWEINNPDEKFTENTILHFRKLRRGVFITIDCITAKDSSGNITGLKSAFYVVR